MNWKGKKHGPVLSKLGWRCSVTQFSALFRREQKRTDFALTQPPSGRSVRMGGALESLWMITAVLPALERANEVRCSFSVRPSSAPRPELVCIKCLTYRISGTIPGFGRTYSALSSDPKKLSLCTSFHLQIHCEDAFSPLLEVYLFS